MSMIVQNILPKRGELGEIHNDILGRECSILQTLMTGRNSLLIEVPFTNSGRDRKILTSSIKKYYEKDDYVTVETENTVYLFKYNA